MRIFTSALLLSLATALSAQTAEIFFFNNLDRAAAADHTVEVANTDGVVVATSEAMPFQMASSILTVPADQIATITYRDATGASLFTQNNVVFNAGRRYFQFIEGGPTGSTGISRGTTSTQTAAPGTFLYRVRNGSYDVGDVDVLVRGTSDKLADNLDQFDNSTTFPDSYAYGSTSLTLDVTPAENNADGICAFRLPASSFSAQNVTFLLSGPRSDLKLFVISNDAVVTELEKVAPVSNVRDWYRDAAPIQVYPNPATGPVTVQLDAIATPITLTLTDLTGRTVLTSPMASASHTLSVRGIPAGTYVLRDSAGELRPTQLVVGR